MTKQQISRRKMKKQKTKQLELELFESKEESKACKFYVPFYKYQLVEWLYDYCERTGKKPKNFREMKKEQLYAIYFNIRRKEKQIL